MDSFGRMFLLVGPGCLILAGLGVTVWIFTVSSGVFKGMVLVFGPALTLVVTLGLIDGMIQWIQPTEGSGFMLSFASIGVYMVGLFAYYFLLMIWFVGRFYKNCRANAEVMDKGHKDE
jgi:hypothetical protein